MTTAMPLASRTPHRRWAARLVGILPLFTAAVFAPPVLAQDVQPHTPEAIEQFLLTAEIVHARRIGKGVTNSWRLTLSNGTIVHDAAFQSINRRKTMARVGRRTELQFADSYHFNIAAYRLARLLGLDDMVPVSVERRWEGRRGALTWWIAAARDEAERKAQLVRPPDVAAWSGQLYRMVVFSELIYDTDRNDGNMLYTKDWRLWVIDFTRAFRVWHELQNPDALVGVRSGPVREAGCSRRAASDCRDRGAPDPQRDKRDSRSAGPHPRTVRGAATEHPDPIKRRHAMGRRHMNGRTPGSATHP